MRGTKDVTDKCEKEGIVWIDEEIGR